MSLATTNPPSSLEDPLSVAIRVLNDNVKERVDLTGGKAFQVEDEDVAELMQYWHRNASVQCLDFSINNITDVGAKTIADAIEKHGGLLMAVELDRNPVGDEGAMAVVKAMPPSMGRLDFSGTNITDDFVKQFVEWMESGNNRASEFHTLVLRDCAKLTDAAFDSICWWLAESKFPLKVLTVSGNDFTDESVPALVHMLKNNVHIRDINISNTRITDYDKVAEAFEDGFNDTVIAFRTGFDGKRLEHPRIDPAVRANKRKAIARNSEITLLKQLHAKEMTELKQAHLKESLQMKAVIEELQGQLELARSIATPPGTY